MTPRQWQCADIITAQHQMLCMLSYWWATVLDLCQHLMAVTTVHHWHMHMIQLHRVCQVLHGYCITINCSALHCTALQGVRLHCTIIQCIALRCVTTHCSAPHNIALRCMVVLCAAARTHISVPAMLVLQYSPWDWGSWPILVYSIFIILKMAPTSNHHVIIVYRIFWNCQTSKFKIWCSFDEFLTPSTTCWARSAKLSHPTYSRLVQLLLSTWRR